MHMVCVAKHSQPTNSQCIHPLNHPPTHTRSSDKPLRGSDARVYKSQTPIRERPQTRSSMAVKRRVAPYKIKA